MPAHLSESEMAALIEAATVDTPLGRRDRAILELFYASGLRLSELAGLDIEDVDLSRRMARVRHLARVRHSTLPLRRLHRHHLAEQ